MRAACVLSFPGLAGEMGLLPESRGPPWATGEGRGELGGDFGLHIRGQEAGEQPCVRSLTHSFLLPVFARNYYASGIFPGVEDTDGLKHG